MEPRSKNIHCPNCGRFLGREDLREGTIDIKCHGCKKWLRLSATQEKLLITESDIDKQFKKD